MSANGLSVVRLLMSWSRLEPEPTPVDPAYLDQFAEHLCHRWS